LIGCRAVFSSRLAYKDAKIMAKRRKPADPFHVPGIEDIEGSNGWPTEQEILDDWRARLSKIVEAYKGAPPASIEGKQATDAKAALVQVEILERVNNPMYLDAAVKLGVIFERMGLRPIEPWIGKSPRVSKAASDKARKTAKLSDDQGDKVVEFIRERPTGVSETERCKQASTHLRKGTLPGLEGVCVTIGADALRRRLAKKRAVSRKR
jgi:hypothetical protein